MRFRAIIFDLDGVLVESELLWEMADRVFANRHTVTLTNELIRSFKGRRQPDIIEEYRRATGLTGETADLVQERSEIVKTILSSNAKMVPGAREFLELLRLSYADVPLAVASSSPHDVIDHELRLFALRDFFRVTVSGEDVPDGKPAPDIYLHTASLLGVVAEECLVIEDSASGVDAAKAAGMTCVALEKPYVTAAESNRADRVIAGFHELTPEMLEAL
ncbi:MAG: HAD family phosphatase [Candidatus Kerfeldbacteria bacterium]|nr:HAD family phosphatase [Candidatus Kerfeldbacteria bacterium]